MQETHCPLCYSELRVRDVAPCHGCGGDPKEIEHFEQGMHSYKEYAVFPPLTLVLCNICDVDFGSFDPAFFGLSRGARIGFERMTLVGSVKDACVSKDKFCASCGYRLAFLRFVAKAREQHGQASAAMEMPGGISG